MSNVDAPDVSSGETNNPNLLAEQSGMPNMSSTKTFTVDTNMQVNGDLDVTGTVTATSFIGDGSQLTGISGGTGGGLDSAAVTLLVDSDYVQAREVPQDFAYSSLTGAPTALSSFTNDTSYITALDIPTTVDSDYVQARVTLDGVGLDSAGVTALVDSDYVAARAPAASGGLEGFDVSQYDSATSNGVFEYNVSPGNQLRHLYSLNDAVSPTAYDGSLEHQVSWTISSNQQFGFRDAGGFRTKVNALANGSTATTGLVLEGETFNNSGVELVGNVKLSSLPTSDPSETGLLWNDGGIPVFSGSTAPSGGGGLDSAGVQLLIDAEVDATTLVLGTGTTAGIRVGSGATASTLSGGGIAIGQNSTATGSQAIAIGINAEGDNNAVAIGISTETANSSVSIGRSANSRTQGVAVGMTTETASSATAIGYNAKAGNNTFGTGSFSVAVGKDAYSQYDHSLHINSAANLGTGPSAVGGIVIESTLGRLEYSAAADWVFNAGVTMTDLVASGATVVFNNLPTVDPVNAGQLWNDAGTMKISAG